MKRANTFAFLALLALPAIAYASGGEEAHESHFWEWVNLILLIGVLFFLARKPASNYLADRRTGIETDLKTAEQLLRDAEARLAECNARVARLDREVDDIKRARAVGAQEAERIVADAKRAPSASATTPRAPSSAKVRRARTQLRKEAAELAVPPPRLS